MLLLSVGIVIVSVAVAIVVAAYSFARPLPLDPRAAALRIAAAAAALSVGSAVMRLIGDRDVNVVSVAFPADTTFVVSIGLMCVAMTMVRQPLARFAAGATLLAGLTVATSSVLLPPDAARIVLLCTLALACGACATLALHNTVLPRPPRIVIAVATAFYALHCATRALAFLTNGSDAVFGAAPFGVSSLAAALLANALVAAAIVMLFLPVARETTAVSRAWTTLTIADWRLVVDAYGILRARELVSELQIAVRDRDPDAVTVRHGISTTLLSPMQILTTYLPYEYGWQPHEVALIDERTEQRAA
ncbi:hypothetical protein [Microbacterium testaceum]|uniref:hypothetical protein n=1 Tax=Microbacterium testaceum TaxID=2033 RepID=UPI0025B2506A|nr:hypothetical protein [Microbacterium testaceum]WJS89597.1 hypothetical protein NYQ11_09570 [Microbacterium testaceum]